MLNDLRYGFRMFLKSPGFTAIAVLTLTLGIGANTAIFSVVHATLRPLPYSNAHQLLMVWENDRQEGNDRNPVAPANFADWKAHNSVFQQMGFFSQPGGVNVTGQDEPERIESILVSVDLFPLLGVKPIYGRTFQSVDEASSIGSMVVLSYGYWQRRFGSDSGLVGKTLTIDGFSSTVIGIMPSGFQLPQEAELWLLWPFSKQLGAVRGSYSLRVVGRLKPDATLEQARANLTTIGRQLEQQYPETNTGRGVNVITLQEQLFGDIQPALLILFGAVGFVLLIACANVANLLLARAVTRYKETAIRLALGAGRFRLVRQWLTESLLLAVTGGVVGLLLASWGVDLFNGVSRAPIPRTPLIGIDSGVLSFTLVVSLLSGTLLGLVPVLHASEFSLSEELKAGRGSRESFRGNWTRSLLAISQLFLSMVLLIGAGLLIKSFWLLLAVDPGFDPRRLLTMQLSLPFSKYREDRQLAAFYRQIIEQIKALPEVESAAVVSRLPLAGDRSTTGLTIQGRPTQPGEVREVHFRVITPEYFRAMSIPFLKGRQFSERDTPQTPSAAIVNEALALRYWPNEDPLGKQIKLGPNPQSPWISLVGVVSNARHFGLDSESRPEVYVPCSQNPPDRVRLIVRTASNPLNVVGAVRSQIRAVDKDLPAAQIATMEQLVAKSVAPRRLNMLLLGIFAAVALILAALGIYGVVAYTVDQRTHEIGVRMALGAQQGDVLKLVVGQGLRLALFGTGTGLIAALVLMRLLQRMLFGVKPADPLTFAGVSLLLVGVAFAASYIPARRATKVDPMVALRYE